LALKKQKVKTITPTEFFAPLHDFVNAFKTTWANLDSEKEAAQRAEKQKIHIDEIKKKKKDPNKQFGEGKIGSGANPLDELAAAIRTGKQGLSSTRRGRRSDKTASEDPTQNWLGELKPVGPPKMGRELKINQMDLRGNLKPASKRATKTRKQRQGVVADLGDINFDEFQNIEDFDDFVNATLRSDSNT